MIHMDNIITRPIEITDYHKEYLSLLTQLTTLEVDKISLDDFSNFVQHLSMRHQIIVMEDIIHEKIIGTITILIENKLIHTMGKVCHIEDVVVDKAVRGQGIGKKLIDHAKEVAKVHDCYKIILDCGSHNVEFYEKCGFSIKGSLMAEYLDH